MSVYCTFTLLFLLVSSGCSSAVESRREGRFAERSLARFRELSGHRSGDGDGGDQFVFTDCPYVWVAREGDEGGAEGIREAAGRMRERGRTVEVVEAADLGAEFPGLRTDDVAAAAVARDAGYADPAAYAELMADRAVAAGASVETDTEVAVEPGSDGASRPTIRTRTSISSGFSMPGAARTIRSTGACSMRATATRWWCLSTTSSRLSTRLCSR